tara:strand:+ start:3979 stop:4335 length:357 start_codon:yes stop_codon:yes gene_type:complete
MINTKELYKYFNAYLVSKEDGSIYKVEGYNSSIEMLRLESLKLNHVRHVEKAQLAKFYPFCIQSGDMITNIINTDVTYKVEAIYYRGNAHKITLTNSAGETVHTFLSFCGNFTFIENE